MHVLYIVCFSTLVIFIHGDTLLEASKKLMQNLEKETYIEKAAEELSITEGKKEKLNLLKAKKTDLTKGFDNFDVRDGANIANAVATGLSKGLPDLVRGIKTKNWFYIAIGSLNLLTSLTVVVGGPYGQMAASVLTIITTVLSIFGKPAQETQENMMKRVLTDMQMDDLKTEVAGVKMFYETLESSVKHFREQPEQLTLSEVTGMYNLAFSSLTIFGKLQAKIEKFCFVGPVTDKTKEKSNLDVDRCFALLKSYVTLTLMRQMLLTEMAGICQEVNELKHMKDNFLFLVKEDQELDKNVLLFLTHPLNSVSARYTIYKLYSAPEENPFVMEYLRRMDKVVDIAEDDPNGFFDNDNVLVCSKEYLQGLCRLVPKIALPTSVGLNSKLVKIDHWHETGSMFIPPLLKVYGKIGEQSIGPLYGLAVFSSSDKLKGLTNMQVLDWHINDADRVRICSHKGWCDIIEDMAGFQRLDKIHGVAVSKFESISIPSGYEVVLTNDKNEAGPIYGEITIQNLCGINWDSIQVRPSKETTAADLTLICSEEDFGGFCQQLGESLISAELQKLKDMKTKDKKKICSVEHVASLRIPTGWEITLYEAGSGIDVQTGPYTGPVEISNMNGSPNMFSLAKHEVVKKKEEGSKSKEQKKGTRRHKIRKHHSID